MSVITQTQTQTQTQQQTMTQRLTLRSEQDVRTPLITWPFLPKVQDTQMKQPEVTQSEATVIASARPQPINRRENLIRASSFVKLRQFCNQSCDALLFLHASRSTLQATVNNGLIQAKACMLVIAVYLAVTVLTLQFAMCLYMLAGKPAPAGLIFMVASLFAIICTFTKIIVSFTKRKSRQPRWVIKTSKKNK